MASSQPHGGSPPQAADRGFAGSSDIEAKVASALSEFPQVRLAYAFGSRASGKMRPDSDLDIAVRLAGVTGDGERGQLKLQLIEALTKTLGPLGVLEEVAQVLHDRAGLSTAF